MNDHIQAEWNFIFLMEAYDPSAFGKISPEIFTNSKTRKFFEAMRDHLASGEKSDIFAVGWRCGMNSHDIATVSGEYFGSNMNQWEFIVKDHYIETELARSFRKAQDMPGLSRIEFVSFEIERIMKTLSTNVVRANAHQRFAKSITESTSLVKTMIPSLDRWLGGFALGNYVIIAGRPSAGKTAFVTTVAYNIARFLELPVEYYSYEMLDYEVRRRIVARVTRIENRKLRYSERLDEDEKQMSLSANDEIEKYPITEIECAGMSIDALISEIAKSKAPVVIVDYIGIIPPSKKGKRYEEISDISNKLRAVAKRTGRVVIALSQMSRDQERVNREPILADLKDSGDLEADADIVLFLYDPEKQQNSAMGNHIVDIRVIGAKVRDGEVGARTLTLDKRYSHFYDAESSEHIPQGFEYQETETVF